MHENLVSSAISKLSTSQVDQIHALLPLCCLKLAYKEMMLCLEQYCHLEEKSRNSS
jgi:hypothetical protein